jgi:hypothetical protein
MMGLNRWPTNDERVPQVVVIQPTDRICLHRWVKDGWQYGGLVLGPQPRAAQRDGARNDKGEWEAGMAITRAWRMDRNRGPWLVLMRYRLDLAVRRACESGLPAEVDLSELESQCWAERTDKQILNIARRRHPLQ